MLMTKRRRFRPPAGHEEAREWEDVQAYRRTSGSRTHVLKPGHPCKVEGLGRGGGAASGCKIVRIERQRDTGELRAEVTDRGGRSRIVPIERVIYVRPPKVRP